VTVNQYGKALPFTGMVESLAEVDVENEVILKSLRNHMAKSLDTLVINALETSDLCFIPTGASSYVWDVDGQFKTRCNMGMVELFPVDHERDIRELKQLIEDHARYTDSSVAKRVLDNWTKTVPQFVKVYPTDYRWVVEQAAGAAALPDEKELVSGAAVRKDGN